MAEQVPLRGQLPPGFQDLLLEEAACRRQAEADLRALFFRWAYTEVIPPTLEYVETLAAGSGASQHQAAYRFLDREGHLLALRTDFTPQVARLAAGRLSGRSLPLRCFYIGSVFRHEEPQAGRQREFTQAGVELLGAGTVAADAEVIALAVNTLEALHVPGFQLCLGQAGLFRALTAGLQPAEVDHIRNAMDRRNPDDLAAALEAAAVGGPRRALLAQLPEQVGGLEILAPFRALGGAVAAAAEALEQVYRALQGHGVADRVALDLGEVRGMEYYTGVTFRGLAPGLGRPVLSGGRYDGLVAHFGRPLPAVGFGLGLERALLLQDYPVPDLAPALLVQGCTHSHCAGLVRRLRAQGRCVEVDVLGRDGDALWAYAQQAGCHLVLRCAGEGARPDHGAGASPAPTEMAHALGDGGPWFLRSAAGERVVQAHEIEEVLA
jgi:ATP phosphoribosyltransferase regulatory subunit